MYAPLGDVPFVIARAKQYCPAEDEGVVFVWRLVLPLTPKGEPPFTGAAVDVADG